MKKVVSIILCLCFLVACLPNSNLMAAEDPTAWTIAIAGAIVGTVLLMVYHHWVNKPVTVTKYATLTPEKDPNRVPLDFSHITNGDFACFVFGDPEKTVEEKIFYLHSQDKKKWKTDSWRKGESCEYVFGNRETTVYFSYFEDKLYSISISFEEHDASLYESITKGQYYDAVQAITTKYGTPQNDFGFPEFYKTQRGFIIFGSRWNLKGKTIDVGVRTLQYKYSANIEIADKRLSAAKEAADKEKEKKKIQDASRDF